MAYPPQIERLRNALKRLPGVVEVEADHTGLEDFDPANLSLMTFGDLPHAAIRRTNGGLPGEALGEVFLTLSPSMESWMTLEFVSWLVRDSSRSGKNVQIRARGLPPVAGDDIQLGTSLLFIIDFFVTGLDTDPERLLHELEEFGENCEYFRDMDGIDWTDGKIIAMGEADDPSEGS